MPLSLFLPALFVVGWFFIGIAVVVRRDLRANEAQAPLAVASRSAGKLAGGLLVAHAFDLTVALVIVIACVLGAG